MPLEITDQYIRIRQQDPDKYPEKRFGTIDEKAGIFCVYGIKDEKSSPEIQAYLFDVEKKH